MAARENQGMMIAVISLVLLVLLLALVAFYGVSKANEYSDTMAVAQDKLLLQEKLAEANRVKSEILESYIGSLGPTVAEVQTNMDSLDRIKNSLPAESRGPIDTIITRVREIRDQYDADMKQFIASDEGDAQEFTWRSLVNNLAAVVSKKHIETNSLRNSITRIQREADAEIAAKQKTVDEKDAALVSARNELQTERERHANEEKNFADTMLAVKKTNEESLESLQLRTDEYTRSVAKLNDTISKTAEQNDLLKEKVDRYEQETFDLADGLVVRSGIKTAYINLGSADGLRVNRTFSVYDADVSNFEAGAQKATIEVIRIAGAHMAEARITRQDHLAPIIRGDKILSPVWDPGYSVPIALVGVIDLDGDGTSDREKLVQMIKKNGGEVVAQHDDEGNIIGKIDSSTRYIVLGDAPVPGPETPIAFLNAIDSLLEQGKNNRVQEIDVRKLLNWMGMHGRGKSERLDNRLGEQFRKREPLGTLKSEDR